MKPTFKDLTQAIQAELPTAVLFEKNATLEAGLSKRGVVRAPKPLTSGQSKKVKNALLDALHTAGELEFATIPPYLTALWSIKDQSQPIAGSIRTIVHEEMLHLALVNNLMVAIGGKPSITGANVPTYPSKLPGGVHPKLDIVLGGLDSANLKIFLEIERPEHVVPIEGQPDPKFPDEDLTIGEFYETVREAARMLDPDFETDHQIAGPLASMVIGNLAQMDEAIDLIRTQGEGADGIPYDSSPEDLAHYYRFKEVQLQHRLIWDPKNRRLCIGEKLDEASAYALNAVPPNGYGNQYPKKIQDLAALFNTEYSRMLDALENAWGGGGHASLLKSVESMFRLRPIARKMMATPGPDGLGHTPEFKYVP